MIPNALLARAGRWWIVCRVVSAHALAALHSSVAITTEHRQQPGQVQREGAIGQRLAQYGRLAARQVRLVDASATRKPATSGCMTRMCSVSISSSKPNVIISKMRRPGGGVL